MKQEKIKESFFRSFQKQNMPQDYFAYLLQVISCFIFPLSYIYTNQHSFTTFNVQIAGSLAGIPLNYLMMRYTHSKISFEDPKYFFFLLKINICIILYLLFLPFSQKYLPLPVVHTIGCSSIIIVYIIDYFINKTAISKLGVFAIIIGFSGVILIANNRLLNTLFNEKYEFQSAYRNYHSKSIFQPTMVAIFLFIARVFNSYSFVEIKKHAQVSVFQINFHRCVLSLFIGCIGYFSSQQQISFEELGVSLLTIGVGQFISFGMFLYSLKLTKKTGNLMILNTTNILAAFCISYFRYDEKMNCFIMTGSSALFMSILIVVLQGKQIKQDRHSRHSLPQKTENKT